MKISFPVILALFSLLYGSSRVSYIDNSENSPLIPKIEEGHDLVAYIVFFDDYIEAFELNKINHTLMNRLVKFTGKSESELQKCMRLGKAYPLWIGNDKSILIKYRNILNESGAYYGVITRTVLKQSLPSDRCAI